MKKTMLLSMLTLCLFASARSQTQTTVDDAVQGTGLNQHNYVGAGWVHGSTMATFYNNTLSFSSVAGAYVTFSFEGNQISWNTERKSTHGIVAVSIDGGAEQMVDLYSSTEQHIVVFNSPEMPQGTHTIKLRATGTKNALSSGFYAIHDNFYVYQEAVPVNANTFFGNGSGRSSPYNQNSGFGYNALNAANGQSNTAVGAEAILSATFADGNTAVGTKTLMNVARAYRNTAIGTHAMSLGAARDRHDNTALGAYALDVTDVGLGNTALGASSGPIEGTLMGNATAVGYATKTTASHQVRIGNANVTSIGGQVSWSTLSDGRFKRDLKEDVSGLEFVNRLRPVSYTVDKTSVQKFLGIPDSVINSGLEAKEKPVRQTGFVAQEVEAAIKKSGYVFGGIDAPKNDKDPYTIRYAEFVVPLVKAVQELSALNEEQQKQINLLLERLDDKEKEDSGMTASGISLLQNNPNPFSVNTEIKMVLPETVGTANIIVYNLEGKQLKQLQVKGRGNVSTTILGNELSAGMYIYALIVDGKVVDTKRMILTK